MDQSITGKSFFDNLLKDVRSGARTLRIPILNDENVDVAHLEPITVATLENETILSALTDWRNANMDSFYKFRGDNRANSQLP